MLPTPFAVILPYEAQLIYSPCISIVGNIGFLHVSVATNAMI